MLVAEAKVRDRPPRVSWSIAYTASPLKCGPSIVHFFRDSSDLKMNAPFMVPTRTTTSRFFDLARVVAVLGANFFAVADERARALGDAGRLRVVLRDFPLVRRVCFLGIQTP